MGKMGKNRVFLYWILALIMTALMLPAWGCGKAGQSGGESRSGTYEVTDASGSVLTLQGKPQKIVSLTISTDEILTALVPHNRIAALSRLADDPGVSNIAGQVQDIQGRVSGSDAEKLAAIRPDLVLVSDFMDKGMVQSLKDLGLPVYVYKTPQSTADIEAVIRSLGKVTGEERKADKMADRMQSQLDALAKATGNIPEARRKTVLYYTGSGIYAMGQSSFQDICRYAGVRDVTDSLHLTQAAPLSEETAIQLNPDVIIVENWNYDGKHDAREKVQEILDQPAYQSTSAVQNKQVFLIPGAHILALSQYIVKASEDIVRDVYPEQFQVYEKEEGR